MGTGDTEASIEEFTDFLRVTAAPVLLVVGFLMVFMCVMMMCCHRRHELDFHDDDDDDEETLVTWTSDSLVSTSDCTK